MAEGLKVILAFILGWAVAQLIKVIITLIKNGGKLKLSEIFAIMMKSGGMPSGHSASMTAAVGTIGVQAGFDSMIFALGLSVLFLTIYDAVNVRYAVGEQGKALNKLGKKNSDEWRNLRVVEGHTMLEMIIGVIIGIAIAYILYIAKI